MRLRGTENRRKPIQKSHAEIRTLRWLESAVVMATGTVPAQDRNPGPGQAMRNAWVCKSLGYCERQALDRKSMAYITQKSRAKSAIYAISFARTSAPT